MGMKPMTKKREFLLADVLQNKNAFLAIQTQVLLLTFFNVFETQSLEITEAQTYNCKAASYTKFVEIQSIYAP